MYYIRSRYWNSAVDGQRHSNHMLVELTASEARECVHASPADDEPDYRRVSPEYARQWVKNDHPHETPLWVDWDGKVRYARD